MMAPRHCIALSLTNPKSSHLGREPCVSRHVWFLGGLDARLVWDDVYAQRTNPWRAIGQDRPLRISPTNSSRVRVRSPGNSWTSLGQVAVMSTSASRLGCQLDPHRVFRPSFFPLFVLLQFFFSLESSVPASARGPAPVAHRFVVARAWSSATAVGVARATLIPPWFPWFVPRLLRRRFGWTPSLHG